MEVDNHSVCACASEYSLLCVHVRGERGAVRVPVGRAVELFLNDGGMVLEVGSGNETNLETLRVAC